MVLLIPPPTSKHVYMVIAAETVSCYALLKVYSLLIPHAIILEDQVKKSPVSYINIYMFVLQIITCKA